MKRLSKVPTISLLVVVVGSATILNAQPDPTTPRLKGNLSFEEMQRQADKFEQQVKDDLRHVKHLQALARKGKDIIKLTCINDKLVQLKPEANIFDSSRRDLIGASATSGDASGLFTLVGEAAGRIKILRGEADACVGEREIDTDSFNDSTHPPFQDDPTLGNPFGEGLEPPGYASPFN